MAQAVEQALAEKRHLIVEAGTGTGKTLAYLLPVIRSGKRVIISTGTKNLQEQLFNKDVPFLEQALFPDGEGKLNVCYMKGRSNYLCRKKLYDLTDQPVLSGLEEIEHYRAIAAWEKVTYTGDRAELAALPEASMLWHKLDARSDTCLGQKCSSFDKCFITEMHRRAMESDIIIVNHHLFFADLAIKQQSEYAPDVGILPEVGAVVFDEAHELEDVAGSYFGVAVSNSRVEELCRDVEASLQRNHALSAALSGAVKSLRDRSMFFFALLPQGEGRFAFENRREFLEENGDEFLALQQSFTRLGSELEGLPSKPEEVFNFVRRAQELQVHDVAPSSRKETNKDETRRPPSILIPQPREPPVGRGLDARRPQGAPRGVEDRLAFCERHAGQYPAAFPARRGARPPRPSRRGLRRRRGCLLHAPRWSPRSSAVERRCDDLRRHG